MKLDTIPKLYAIRNKHTLKFLFFGSKCAWVSVGAAKNAYRLHTRCWERRGADITQSSEFEIVCINGSLV